MRTSTKKTFMTILITLTALCLAMGIFGMRGNSYKASADPDENLTATKVSISSDFQHLLLVTVIKDVTDVYEVGYDFGTALTEEEKEKTDTDKYYTSITSGENTWTAKDIFGDEYAEDDAMIVWQIKYSPAKAYTCTAYYYEGTRDGEYLYKNDTDVKKTGTAKTIEVPNYDFSSATDSDVYVTSAINGAIHNGIVADANATDGYAVKATTVVGTEVGLLIGFNNITLADWDGIVLRFRATNSVGVQVYSEKDGAWINAANWGNYPSYTNINLKGVLEANGDTTLTQFRITRDMVADIEIYVDHVIFHEVMPSPYNMTGPASEMPSVAGGTTSIVEDAGVSDGYALQIATGTTNWQHCYLTLSTPFTYNDYAAIKIRLKKTGGYIYVTNGSNTGVSCSYGIPDTTYNEFVDFYIFPTANVAKIDFCNGSTNNIVFTIDDIELIPVSELDNFYAYGEDTVTTSKNATIVADETAEDGYALKIVRNEGNNAYYYLGRSFTVANYEHIYVRCRLSESGMGVYVRNATTPNKSTGDGVSIGGSISTSGYTTIDILPLLTTIDTFNQIDIWDNGSKVLYIDSIDFVKSPYNMTSLTDEMPTVSGGTTSIVADAGVADGYALQIATGTTNWQHCYLTLSTPFTYNDYAAIKIRLKKTGGYIYVTNASNTSVPPSYSIPDVAYNEFVDFYIFPTADVAKIDFCNGSTTNIVFTIDDIKFVPVSELDNFYAYGEGTVTTSKNATIVADENAEDGYALKIIRNEGNNAYYYLGRSFTVADYEHIYVRCRCDSGIGVYVRNATTPNKSTGDGVSIGGSISTSEYTTIDLVTILTTLDTFNQIDIWNNASAAVYIDSITFVKKAA